MSNKIEVLDLVIDILREHEKELSNLIDDLKEQIDRLREDNNLISYHRPI